MNMLVSLIFILKFSKKVKKSCLFVFVLNKESEEREAKGGAQRARRRENREGRMET